VHPNAELITRFYGALQRRDGAMMAACYAPAVIFSDPVFPRLEGAHAGAMWRMLCERGADLEVIFGDVHADDARGSAHWDARYTFTQTGRKVLNRIDATFEFSDGAIVRHTDSFDLHRWMRQALGPVGLLLGWTPLVKNKVRSSAAAALAAWEAKHAGAGAQR
jgi:ketosteroid isomerase-like protein